MLTIAAAIRDHKQSGLMLRRFIRCSRAVRLRAALGASAGEVAGEIVAALGAVSVETTPSCAPMDMPGPAAENGCDGK